MSKFHETFLLILIAVSMVIVGAFAMDSIYRHNLIEMGIAEYNQQTGDWQYKAEYRIIK